MANKKKSIPPKDNEKEITMTHYEELKGLITSARAEVLEDFEALARKIAELEETVVILDKDEDEELKGLITENREFTQQVHDAIVSRVAALEGKVFKLGTTVSGIRGAERKFPQTKEYTVAPGDKLTGIAKRQLGQAGRFTEIAILNYDRYPSLKTNPDHIQEGWKLRLPD